MEQASLQTTVKQNPIGRKHAANNQLSISTKALTARKVRKRSRKIL